MEILLIATKGSHLLLLIKTQLRAWGESTVLQQSDVSLHVRSSTVESPFLSCTKNQPLDQCESFKDKDYN